MTRKIVSEDPIAYLRQRSIEEGECWIWQLCVNGARHPVASFSGSHHARPVRRWLWQTLNGDPGPQWRIIAQCGEAKCVNPAHLQRVTPAGMNRWMHDLGRVQTAAKRRACRQNARARSRFTMDDVREMRRMRDDGALLKVIAERYDSSVSHVARICRGEQWQDAADPFALLRQAA